jgi:aminoglycoside phosphotransferase family enzyme
MLDRAVAAGPVAPAELAPAARLLADFFASAPPEPLARGQLVARLRAELRENREELARYADALPVGPMRGAAAGLERFLDRDLELVEGRVHAGRVVEGHGDLRPEHVFLGPQPAVIDCLEFNRAFRILDPADELAFLGLELERLGAPHLALPFLDAYRNRTGDRPSPRLIAFYAGHRALLRAKLAIWHLADHVAEPEKWVARARTYLELAGAYAARLEPA